MNIKVAAFTVNEKSSNKIVCFALYTSSIFCLLLKPLGAFRHLLYSCSGIYSYSFRNIFIGHLYKTIGLHILYESSERKWGFYKRESNKPFSRMEFPTLINWTSQFAFIFIKNLIEHSLSKHWRP